MLRKKAIEDKRFSEDYSVRDDEALNLLHEISRYKVDDSAARVVRDAMSKRIVDGSDSDRLNDLVAYNRADASEVEIKGSNVRLNKYS